MMNGASDSRGPAAAYTICNLDYSPPPSYTAHCESQGDFNGPSTDGAVLHVLSGRCLPLQDYQRNNFCSIASNGQQATSSADYGASNCLVTKADVCDTSYYSRGATDGCLTALQPKEMRPVYTDISFAESTLEPALSTGISGSATPCYPSCTGSRQGLQVGYYCDPRMMPTSMSRQSYGGGGGAGLGQNDPVPRYGFGSNSHQSGDMIADESNICGMRYKLQDTSPAYGCRESGNEPIPQSDGPYANGTYACNVTPLSTCNYAFNGGRTDQTDPYACFSTPRYAFSGPQYHLSRYPSTGCLSPRPPAYKWMTVKRSQPKSG